MADRQQEFLDRLSAARASGYSWDEINASVDARRQRARDAGYSDDEINEALGFNPGDLSSRLRAQAEENLAASTPEPSEGGRPPPPENAWFSFQNSLRNATPGLMWHGLPDPNARISDWDEDVVGHLAGLFGSMLGESPFMFGGGAMGAAAGTAAAGPAGTIPGAMIGAFAAPAWFHSLYGDALEKGEVTGPADYAGRQVHAAWEAVKAGSVGAATATGGVGAAGLAVRAGAGPAVAGGTQFTAEVTSMVSMGSLIAGELPKMEDFIDAAVVLGAFKTGYDGTRRALIRHYKATGEKPQDAVARARQDEAFRQRLLQESVKQPDRPAEAPKPAEEPVKPAEATKPPATPKPAPPPPTDPVQQAASEVASRFGRPGEGAPEAPLSTETKAGTVYRELFNAEHPLRKVLDQVREGRDVSNVENPVLLLRAARNSSDVARFTIEKGQVRWNSREGAYEPIPGRKGLEEIVKPFEKEKGDDNFWTFAGAKWAVERSAQGFETGVDPLAARDYVAARRGKYQEAYDRLIEWQNNTLEAFRGDILPDAAMDRILQHNIDYIPAQRIGPDGKPFKGTGGTGIHPFKGSELKVKNTQELLLKRAFARYTIAANNRGQLAAYRLAKEIGAAREVPGKKLNIKLTMKELEKLEAEILKDPEFDPSSANIWRTLGQKGELRKNEQIFFEEGKLKRVEYDDPAIAALLKGTDIWGRPEFLKPFANWVRFVRASVTHMPDFPVRMSLWDVQLRALTNPDFRTEIAGTIDGTLRLIVGDKAVNEMYLAGGRSNLMPKWGKDPYIQNKLKHWAGDVSRAEASWNNIKRMNPLNLFFWWSQVWHKGAQYGKFREGVKKGESKLEAAAKGAEAAFPRIGGGGRAAQAIDEHIFFANAYAQSVELMVRAQLGRFGGKTAYGKSYNAAKFTAGALLTITLPTIFHWWMYKDEDWYKALSDFEKDNSWLIIPPTEHTPAMPIHAIPIASFVYGALPLRAVKAWYEEDPEAVTRGMDKSAAWSFLPPGLSLMASLSAPIFGKMANFNFGTGYPIVPDWMKDQRLPPQQYTGYSTWTARKIAEALWMVPVIKGMNMNPAEIDMFIGQWSGPAGLAAIKWSEALARKSGILDPELASRPIWELPGFTAWTASYPSASAEPIRRFQDKMTEYDRILGSLRQAMLDGDVDNFRKLANVNPTMTAMASHDLRDVQALQAATNPNFREIMEVLQSAVQGVDVGAAQEILTTKLALELSRKVAQTIELAETPETREFVEQGYQTLLDQPTKMEGPLTDTDKRQLLDRLYIGMQHASERGNAALRRSRRP